MGFLGNNIGFRNRSSAMHEQLLARLYHLRQQAIFTGDSFSLQSEDFPAAAGTSWLQTPLLGFAPSGYPSKAGTIVFQASTQLFKIVLPPASGAIRYEVTGL